MPAKKYSNALRAKIRTAFERGGQTIAELAETFSVHEKSIARWSYEQGWGRQRKALQHAASLTAKQYVELKAAEYASDGARVVEETVHDTRAIMAKARAIVKTKDLAPRDLDYAVSAMRGAIAERRRAIGLDGDDSTRRNALVNVHISGAESVLAGVPCIEAECAPVPTLEIEDTPRRSDEAQA